MRSLLNGKIVDFLNYVLIEGSMQRVPQKPRAMHVRLKLK